MGSGNSQMPEFSKKENNFLIFVKTIMVILIVIVVLFSGNTSLAKFELNKLELEIIKTNLNIPTIPGLSQLTDKELIELLGEKIDPKNLPGLTYGTYSLLVFQEIDFIDWIVSQDYKHDFSTYFENIVEERTRLDLYWKNLSKDVSIILERTPSGPISALSLNTFSMTSKVLEIGRVLFKFVEQRICDGLWGYFDSRRNGESHEIAWEWATSYMKWIPKTEHVEKNLFGA